MSGNLKLYRAKPAQSSTESRELIPAATVILLRNQGDGLETLMLRRNSKLEFVGGMWVFPGGRIDEADRRSDDEDELTVARRAAVREAREESGLAPDEASLEVFAHWTPPPITPRRFSTWFFMAPAPEGEVTIDGGEIHDHRWIRPSDAMQRRDAGEIELAPPTWVTLDLLARFDNVDAALEHSRASEVEHFSTRICMTDDGPIALWQGDAGYESSDPTLPGARQRLALGDGAWRYENER
jgi:8-oxo-dGTP pyrophosphatase MutT (NUDIX family)